MSQRTKQEYQDFFDEATRRLGAQGYCAVRPSGSCVYRTDEGYGCAIGIMLTEDEIAAISGRNGLVYNIILNHGDELPTLAGYDIEFLSALQRLHDRNGITEGPIYIDAVREPLEKYVTPSPQQIVVLTTLKDPRKEAA